MMRLWTMKMTLIMLQWVRASLFINVDWLQFELTDKRFLIATIWLLQLYKTLLSQYQKHRNCTNNKEHRNLLKCQGIEIFYFHWYMTPAGRVKIFINRVKNIFSQCPGGQSPSNWFSSLQPGHFQPVITWCITWSW